MKKSTKISLAWLSLTAVTVAVGTMLLELTRVQGVLFGACVGIVYGVLSAVIRFRSEG